MTALLEQLSHDVITVADYLRLGEDERYRWELQEGNLTMSPSPKPRHGIAAGELYSQLRSQLPPSLSAIPDVDVDLQLVPESEPGTVRRPDLVVVDNAALDRVERDGGVLRASDVLLAVEIMSPGSRRTDQTIKRAEYADAGIGRYWIIDLDGPRPTLTDGFAADALPVTGVYRQQEPFRVSVDLDGLIRKRS